MSILLRRNSLISPTAQVAPGARIGLDVEIGPNCIIEDDVVIGNGCWIGANVVIYSGTVIGRENRIFHGAVIGQTPQDLKYAGEATRVEIGDGNQIREYVTISRGTAQGGGLTRVGSRSLLMAYVHVGHDCQVGDEVIVANGTQLAGHVVVEDGAVIGGLTGVHQFTRIGRKAMVGACSKLTADVPPFVLADGNPARARGVNVVGLRRGGMSAADRMEVQRAYRVLYRSGLNRSQALEKLLAGGPPGEALDHLIRFVQTSERGILRSTREGLE